MSQCERHLSDFCRAVINVHDQSHPIEDSITAKLLVERNGGY